MLPEDHNYGKQTQVFHIQNPEDFYNKLREYHTLDLAIERERETDDLELARNMLRGIGVNV